MPRRELPAGAQSCVRVSVHRAEKGTLGSAPRHLQPAPHEQAGALNRATGQPRCAWKEPGLYRKRCRAGELLMTSDPTGLAEPKPPFSRKQQPHAAHSRAMRPRHSQSTRDSRRLPEPQQ